MRRAANQIRSRINESCPAGGTSLERGANFLVSNLNVILLPSFDTSQMVPRKNRRIRKKSVRQLLTIQEAFTTSSKNKKSDALLDKAEQHGKHVIM